MHVVVVGGGIVGLSSAYHLRERGADVTLLERKSLGAGSTDRAAGGIRAQFSTPESVGLSKASIAVWERFGDEFGVDIEYRRPGYLYLARTEATAARFDEAVAFQNDHGVPSRVVGVERAADLVPGLRTENYVAGAYSPEDGFADPHLALQGFAGAAADAGVEVRTNAPVTGVRTDGDRVVGVDTPDGPVEADCVVNAAGSWSPRVAEMAGVDLPITPKRRQVMVVEPDSPVPDDVPLTTDLDDGVYYRPEREGTALVGGHFDADDPAADPDAYRTDYEFDWAGIALEHAAGSTDRFGPDTEIRRGWAGLYAMTPDHHPVIEEVRPGFVVAAGFSGHGFMQSPATGQCVSELVVDGAASTVDVSRLTADRFERDAGLSETYFSA